MNLVSCEGCGVVLDKDNLSFPAGKELYCEGIDDTFDSSKVVWEDGAYYTIIPCPVCQSPIIGDKV